MVRARGLTVLIAATVVAFACGSTGGGSSSKGDIWIASDLPVSGSDASSGLPAQNGANYAVTSIGTVQGYTLHIKNYDDAVNGKEQASGNRNNQILFTLESTTWSAIGMRFEASYTNGQYDEGIIDAKNPLDYLIREAVHVRPGTLVVRALHRRAQRGQEREGEWYLLTPLQG